MTNGTMGPSCVFFAALYDVARWLGFEDAYQYNKWCEICSPDEFRDKLLNTP